MVSFFFFCYFILKHLSRLFFRFLSHSYDFGPRDFAILLAGVLHFLLIGFTIYQYLPSSPKGKITIFFHLTYIPDVYEAIGYWYLLIAVLNGGVSFLWVKEKEKERQELIKKDFFFSTVN